MKFSEILSEYLTIREEINSGYYDNKWMGSKTQAENQMREHANQMDEMVGRVCGVYDND